MSSIVAMPSVLFLEGEDAPSDPGLERAASFRDLNLDQLVDALVAGREAYDLRGLFCAKPLPRDAIVYRQEVARELERPALISTVRAFVSAMRAVREYLDQTRTFHHPRQADWWQLAAVLEYGRAVIALAAGLRAADPEARGLRALSRYVYAYTASARFAAMTEGARAVERDLGAVAYSVRVRDAKVTVLRYGGEVDQSESVSRTFARFRRSAARDYRAKFVDHLEMNHLEGQILDRVAALFPDVFGRLAALRAGEAGGDRFIDPVLAAFDREVQFYSAYLAYTEPLRRVGLPFCYPEIVALGQDSVCRSTFDLVLASKLAADGIAVVTSDWQAGGSERAFVVTGPNHGGKTTFARAIGQIHVLAAMGLPVPGAEARLPAVDGVFTHFEREERAAQTPSSKFEDDLVRIRDILDKATPSSLVVINEMLASTTLRDGVEIGRRLLGCLAATGARFVWVTFIEALARADGVVSLACVAGDDLGATFAIARRPPTGLAHAMALARRYGLDGDALKRRLGS